MLTLGPAGFLHGLTQRRGQGSRVCRARPLRAVSHGVVIALEFYRVGHEGGPEQHLVGRHPDYAQVAQQLGRQLRSRRVERAFPPPRRLRVSVDVAAHRGHV